MVAKIIHQKGNYPLVIKQANGKFPMNGGVIKKTNCKWSIFQHAMFDYRWALTPQT